VWAKNAQAAIAEVLNPGILEMYNKKNLRSLTSAEYNEAERVKFGVLSNLEPMSDLNPDIIKAALGKEVPVEVDQLRSHYLAELKAASKKTPMVDDVHQIQAFAYALYQENLNE
jgi:hypothetical protein